MVYRVLPVLAAGGRTARIDRHGGQHRPSHAVRHANTPYSPSAGGKLCQRRSSGGHEKEPIQLISLEFPAHLGADVVPLHVYFPVVRYHASISAQLHQTNSQVSDEFPGPTSRPNAAINGLNNSALLTSHTGTLRPSDWTDVTTVMTGAADFPSCKLRQSHFFSGVVLGCQPASALL